MVVSQLGLKAAQIVCPYLVELAAWHLHRLHHTGPLSGGTIENTFQQPIQAAVPKPNGPFHFVIISLFLCLVSRKKNGRRVRLKSSHIGVQQNWRRRRGNSAAFVFFSLFSLFLLFSFLG